MPTALFLFLRLRGNCLTVRRLAAVLHQFRAIVKRFCLCATIVLYQETPAGLGSSIERHAASSCLFSSAERFMSILQLAGF